MKEANLLSIVQGCKHLREPLLTKYLDYYKITLKKNELQCLEAFTKSLKAKSSLIEYFDKYYLGYTIPQISKEFDLLRFGENYNINIELKRTHTKDKIKEQLKRNKYYLGFLDVNTINFSYVADENQLFRLDNNDDLIEDNFEELTEILKNQKVKYVSNLDGLFNPSDYLVSPFNSTDEFIKNKYFLTNQQEIIKKETLIKLNLNEATFILVSGKAGTGKSLLVYDIAKECINKDLKVLLIHCGKLNNGHRKLRDEHKWDIIPIKDLSTKTISDYSLVILDEIQRIYPGQLEYITKEVNAHKKSCIFSSDQRQCLKEDEAINKIEERIINTTNPSKHQLTDKIRTNKEIASFIKGIFNKNFNIVNLDRSNIELHYFKEIKEAKQYLELLNNSGWKIINYTPSKKQSLPYDNYHISLEDNAHEVIGQEFDKVVAVVDSHFSYNKNKLCIVNHKSTPFYDPVKMLFQIMTRTRRKLSFIVIDNNEVMDRCLSILDNTFSNQLVDLRLLAESDSETSSN